MLMQDEMTYQETFKSRIDWFFKGTLLAAGSVVMFSAWSLISDENESFISKILFLLVVGVVVSILVHICTHTFYRFDQEALHIQSSVFKKRVKYENITEVRRNKTLYVGWKLALASKGLVIHFNKYDVIYVSPVNEELFLSQLLQINPNIEISSK